MSTYDYNTKVSLLMNNRTLSMEQNMKNYEDYMVECKKNPPRHKWQESKYLIEQNIIQHREEEESLEIE